MPVTRAGQRRRPRRRDAAARPCRGRPGRVRGLFRRHRDRLWAVALRTMGDREDAADALQDALLSAHRAAARFRGDAAVTTWLHRIVVNACLDRIRRRQAHPTVPLPDGDRDPTGPVASSRRRRSPTTTPPSSSGQALAQLPADQRAALVLVDVQGYPVAEAAVILGVAEGTIKSRCARGRARLAMLLGHLRPSPARAPSPRRGTTGRRDPSASTRRSTTTRRRGCHERARSTSTCSPTTSAARSTAPPTGPRSPAGRHRPGWADGARRLCRRRWRRSAPNSPRSPPSTSRCPTTSSPGSTAALADARPRPAAAPSCPRGTGQAPGAGTARDPRLAGAGRPSPPTRWLAWRRLCWLTLGRWRLSAADDSGGSDSAGRPVRRGRQRQRATQAPAAGLRTGPAPRVHRPATTTDRRWRPRRSAPRCEARDAPERPPVGDPDKSGSPRVDLGGGFDGPGQLGRLTGASALADVPRRDRHEHGVPIATVTAVDFARYEGKPALVVFFTDTAGARWAWVAGRRLRARRSRHPVLRRG